MRSLLAPGVRDPSNEPTALTSKNSLVIIAAFVAVIFAIGGGLWMKSSEGAPVSRVLSTSFVGSETCAGCHRAEADLWRNSHHARAMDHATDKTVLGDFNEASFDYFGVRSRFFRKEGKFLVETDGPDGKLAIFQVKYTFGVDPLQQYLVEFPDGRLQALAIAWDSRPKEAGGRRWFHLYPKEYIRYDDELHWTKLNQNWNFMCAECHSTGVRKNYDAASDRFATTWTDINVGCETCHGPGLRHVSWARDIRSGSPPGEANDPDKGLVVRFDERAGVVWRQDLKTGGPLRGTAPADLRKEVETCGLCHARRGQLSEDWLPGRSLSDTHIVAPISEGLYSADGQMLDVEETYNYVPFRQSKMFAAGVTCSDCHEPHSAKLVRSGDTLCLGCHSADFETSAHHHHEQADPPLACVSCHMPTRNYMVVDHRHDHSFRIPRPDLSVKLQTPNACNVCHADKSPEWAAAEIVGWHGPARKGFQNYAEAFRAAWSEAANAEAMLMEVAANMGAPAVARASALTAIAANVSQSAVDLAREQLGDPDPMVRIGALEVLKEVPAAQSWRFVAPLLDDPIRGVRIQAASLLVSVPTANQPPADRDRFERAAAEFVAAELLNADRPEARAALGAFYVQRDRFDEAETQFTSALHLNPRFAPAAIDLADLYRQRGRAGEASEVLRTAIQTSPSNGDLHHALGLELVREQRLEEALGELRRASELEPDRARYSYVYAVALNSAGQPQEAMTQLKEALTRHPNDRDVLTAIVAFSRDNGDFISALEYARRLAHIVPDDENLARLIHELSQRVESDKR